MNLTGIHHLTAVTADTRANHAFYTGTLGLRLVKRTVNQDDVSAYHLFYADGLASPGTDVTFFDWPAPREKRGTNAITRTALRVSGAAAFAFWHRRLADAGVSHTEPALIDDRMTLLFEDGEGQRLALVDDGGEGAANPWAGTAVPAQHQIRGLGPITLSVPDLEPTDAVLRNVLNMRRARDYANPAGASSSGANKIHVYEMGAGGAAAELHIALEPELPPARQGAGAVHHVALRTPDEAEYREWAARLKSLRVPNSGPVDRYYFKSLYFREPNGILFEIATDGPGFATDEPMDRLGERLALPPFLEPRRAEIEAGLKPLL